jgi:hypothetical protein
MEKKQYNKWTLTTVMSVFLLSGLLAACGKSGGNDNTSATYAGLIPTCTANGCTYGLPVNYKAGAYAQTSNLVTPGYVNNASTFVPRQGMYQVLKDAMGVCDRTSISGGLAGCQTWFSGAHDMVIYLNGQQASQAQTVKLIIRSTPNIQMGGYGYYSYSLPNFKQFILGLFGYNLSSPAGVFDPMVLDATIWPINDNRGFEVRANGPRNSYAWNKLFQLQVANGKLEDPSWDYQLYFNGQLAADGRGAICQSQYCGMDSSYFTGYGY